MKYTEDIIINKPKSEVVAKFDSKENLKHWMEGFQSFETFEGEEGQNGAKAKIVFVNGKRRMEMTETIIDNSFPDYFTTTYDAPGVHNIVKNIFEEVDENTTRVANKQEFQFKSFGMKVFGVLMPSLFKKQSRKYLNNLKAFVEEGKSVLD